MLHPGSNSMPFLKFLIALAGGIILSSQVESSVSRFNLALFQVAGFLLFLLACKSASSYHSRWVAGMAVYLFLFLAGYSLHEMELPPQATGPRQVNSTGVVESVENRFNGWHRLAYRPKVTDPGSANLVNTLWQVMVRGCLPDTLEEGMVVAISGTLDKLPASRNPGAFDYGKYLERNGFSGQMFIRGDQISLVDANIRVSLRQRVSRTREMVLELIGNSGISPANTPVLNAFLLGDRHGLEREVTEHFIRSGTIHILAVSGMHVGILYLVFNSFFSLFLKRSHPFKGIVIIALMFAFALLAGFSPSIARAVLMFSIIQAGKMINRETSTYNLLCVSAFILLLFNPMYLFHAGFWLSHLAVAGIVAFYPFINALCPLRFIVFRWLWSLVAVTLSAQVATLPYSLHLFGAFPAYFLVANLLVLPVVAPVLILSLVILVISPLDFLSRVAGGALDSMLGYMVEIASYIESLQGSYIENIWVSLPLAVALYAMMVFALRARFAPGGKSWVRLAVSGGIVLLLLNVQYFHKLFSETVVVYNTGRHTVIDVFKGGGLIHFYSGGIDPGTSRHARDGMLRKYRIKGKGAYFLKLPGEGEFPAAYVVNAAGKKYLLLCGDGKFDYTALPEVKVDGLVLTGDLDVDPVKILAKVSCDIIIHAPACPPWMVYAWQHAARELGIEVYDVRQNGAYIASGRIPGWPGMFRLVKRP